MSVHAEDEHPWVGIASSSVFGKRILEYRDSHGWPALRNSLYKDSRYAYERRIPSAERLLYSFLWVDLMYEKEAEYVPEWIEKMEQANRIHGNMPDT